MQDLRSRLLSLRASVRQDLAKAKPGSSLAKVLRGKLYGVEECLRLALEEPRADEPGQGVRRG